MFSAVHPTTDIARILRHVRFVPRADLAADRTRSICGRKWNKRFALHRDHAAHTPPQPMSVLGLVGVIVCHYRLSLRSGCLAGDALPTGSPGRLSDTQRTDNMKFVSAAAL